MTDTPPGGGGGGASSYGFFSAAFNEYTSANNVFESSFGAAAAADARAAAAGSAGTADGASDAASNAPDSSADMDLWAPVMPRESSPCMVKQEDECLTGKLHHGPSNTGRDAFGNPSPVSPPMGPQHLVGEFALSPLDLAAEGMEMYASQTPAARQITPPLMENDRRGAKPPASGSVITVSVPSDPVGSVGVSNGAFHADFHNGSATRRRSSASTVAAGGALGGQFAVRRRGSMASAGTHVFSPVSERRLSAAGRPRRRSRASFTEADEHGMDDMECDDNGPAGDGMDMGSADTDLEVKRQRFLERNRVAASKSRQKKKQWMQELETRARTASQHSQYLQTVVARLKEEMLQLKTELLKHEHCNCPGISKYLTQEVKNLSSGASRRANQAPSPPAYTPTAGVEVPGSPYKASVSPSPHMDAKVQA